MKMMSMILAGGFFVTGCLDKAKSVDGSSLASVTVKAPSGNYTPGVDYNEVRIWSKLAAAVKFDDAVVMKIASAADAKDQKLTYKKGTYNFKMQLIKNDGGSATAFAGTVVGKSECDINKTELKAGADNTVAIALCLLAANTPAAPTTDDTGATTFQPTIVTPAATPDAAAPQLSAKIEDKAFDDANANLVSLQTKAKDIDALTDFSAGVKSATDALAVFKASQLSLDRTKYVAAIAILRGRLSISTISLDDKLAYAATIDILWNDPICAHASAH